MAQGDFLGALTLSSANTADPADATGSEVVAVGDLVFVTVSQQTNLTAVGVTDNLGNTYAAVNAGTDAGNCSGRSFYSRVTVAGTLTTVSIDTTASTNDMSVVASVFAGPFVVSPLDANPANNTDGTSPFSCPATGTLSQASELVIGAITFGGNQTFTANSPFALAGTVNRNNASTAHSFLLVSATDSVQPTFDGGTLATTVDTTASFKLVVVYTLALGAASYAFTGQAVSLELGREIIAGAVSYAFTPQAVTLSKGQTLAIGAASYSFGTQDASLELGREIIPGAAAYSFTGQDVSLELGREIVAGAVSYSFNAQDVTLTKSGANKILALDAVSYSFTAQDVSLEYGRQIAVDSVSYAFTAQDITLTYAPAEAETPTGGGWLSEEQVRAYNRTNKKRRDEQRAIEETITLAYQRLTGKISAEPIIKAAQADPAKLAVQAEKLAKQLVEKSKSSDKQRAKNKAIIAELKRLAHRVAEQQIEEEAIVLLLA